MATMTAPPKTTALGPIRLQFPNLITKAPLPKKLLRATPAGTADTNGWDTVFAIPVQYVNQAIVDAEASPTTFQQSDSTLSASITGTFGDWQIAIGGSGELLAMTVPIPSATLTFANQDYPMTNLTATILVNLTYVEQSNVANGQGYNLQVNPQPAGGTPAVIMETLLPVNSNSMLQLVTEQLLLEWLNANLASFAYVFNTVNLNMQADQAQWQWLMPTTVAYAYAADPGGSLNNSTFAVLCMTQNKLAPTPQVSPYAIPPGAQAGFCINTADYLGNLMLPMMPQLFSGASASDFTYETSGGILTNTNPVNMDPVSVNGSDKTPTVPTGGLSVSVTGSEVEIAVTNLHVEFSPGIDIYVNYTQWYQLSIYNQSAGTQTIIFNQSTVPGHTEAASSHSVEIATWVTVTEIVASLIAATIGVVVGIAGPMATIAMKIVVGLIIAVVLNVITNIPQYMNIAANNDWDKLPPINAMVTNATNPVTWPGGTDFTPTSAQLNASLQLGGTLNFA